jgi:hypothetical protein
VAEDVVMEHGQTKDAPKTIHQRRMSRAHTTPTAHFFTSLHHPQVLGEQVVNILV